MWLLEGEVPTTIRGARALRGSYRPTVYGSQMKMPPEPRATRPQRIAKDSDNDHMTNEEILDEMRRLRKFYALKGVIRYRGTRDGAIHAESVAEHLFGMQILSHYFLLLEDPNHLLDWGRISELILYHEIGEIETGDILFHRKFDAHRLEEHEAAKRVAAELPASLSEVALARFLEFEECKTDEARFVDAIDKIEPIFELFEHDIALGGLKRLGVTKDVGINGKYFATEPYPHMRRFLDAWTEYAVSQNAFAE